MARRTHRGTAWQRHPHLPALAILPERDEGLGLGLPVAIHADALRIHAHSYREHARVRFGFGPIEHWLATPAFHHGHHANEDASKADVNFSAIFF